METTVMQIFINYGWSFRNRIEEGTFASLCLVVSNSILVLKHFCFFM
jgi:hypothetical protein